MTIYNLYIFDRNGVCLFYQEWTREKHPGMSQEEEFKLMYGMIFSIKSFVSRMAPVDFKDGFSSFCTSSYKLHFHETASGLKFVMNTSLNVGSIHDELQHIYSAIFVEHVVRNPLSKLGQAIDSQLFKTKLDSYVRGLPFFTKVN
ncbi:trafficking protein particle complex subunit 1-like [Patiria miniata]|uniref:Trafficking protein particle complex subunit n=1 Tax=Patiria miniata TaxID=46514 RepID=A0A913ZIL1_PATMI|nr:trafficking protein particle complex subunit 1-like [Patiria miniata]